MNELTSILHAWKHGATGLQDAVLVTVVQVKGSSYRRPGARMLVLPDGTRLGTISGGCLENDVARKAAWWTSGGVPTLRTFDTSSEQAAWEFGLGCNGVITVLLERLGQPAVEEQMRFLEARLASRRGAVVCTVVRSTETSIATGTRLHWDDDGVAGGALAGSSLADALAPLAEATRSEQRSRWAVLDGIEVFVEWVAPPQRLVVFGAGHDAMPLVAMASLLGWSVTVADARALYARPDRFPGAERVVRIRGEAGDVDAVEIDRATAVVVMTHHFEQDAALLPGILARRPCYVGLLGPRKRAERLFAEAGLPTVGPNVFAPVGLDIGSDHPETIALSIIAEIQAVLTGRSSGFLRHRPGPIHATTPTVVEEGRPEPAGDWASERVAVECSTCALHA